MTNKVIVPARQAKQASGIYSLESIPGLLKSLKHSTKARIFKCLRSPGIDSTSLCSLAGQYDNLVYHISPTRLHRLAKLFLKSISGSLNVYKFGLCCLVSICLMTTSKLFSAWAISIRYFQYFEHAMVSPETTYFGYIIIFILVNVLYSEL